MKCVTLQNGIAEMSYHIGYRQIRFLLLVSLLVIGCVELNPGPHHVHGFLREHYTAWVKEEMANNSLNKITVEMEKFWKP